MPTTLLQTTLTAAVAINQTAMPVASVTGISAPTNNLMQKIYVIDPGGTRGELMDVASVSGLQVSVSRLCEFKSAHASGSVVLIGPQDPLIGQGFQAYDPVGVITSPAVTPWVNTTNGNQWVQGLSNVWVPGFNTLAQPAGVATAVASAAGPIIPSGQLFHVTGTAAITGFTIPVGFAGGSFTIIPDAVFTWTAAGNISIAGTAVVNKALTFTYDSNTAKFTPSYIA